MRASLTAIGVALITAMAGPTAAQAAITIGPATVTSTGETGKLTFTVTRSMNVLALTSASVKVNTVAGTATPGVDFTPLVDTTVTLAAPTLGATTQTVDVPILGDALDEVDEDLTVQLSAPSGDSLGAPSTARGVIADDDVPPSVTLGTPAPVTEGTGGTGPVLAFPVTLSAPSGKAVSVTYATADGTAVAPGDYTSTAGGTLMLPAGTTTATIDVPVEADALDEDDETLGLTISGPANATLGATTHATGTVTDDDTATLSVTGAVVPEGAAGTTSVANAQVDLSTVSSRDVSVAFTTVDGTATAPGDYMAATGRVTIPAGQRFALVPITVVGDATPEATEVLGVRLADAVGGAIAPGADLAPIVLTNDDGAIAPPAPAPVTPGPSVGGGTTSVGGGTASRPVRLGKPSFSRTTGRLRYKVTCPVGGGACRVGLTVFSVPAAKSKVKALRREQQLGTKTLTVPAGRTVTFELRLSTRARGWLRAAKSIRTNAYAVSKDATGAFSTARAAATLKR